jgi:hypothetical protein
MFTQGRLDTGLRAFIGTPFITSLPGIDAFMVEYDGLLSYQSEINRIRDLQQQRTAVQNQISLLESVQRNNIGPTGNALTRQIPNTNMLSEAPLNIISEVPRRWSVSDLINRFLSLFSACFGNPRVSSEEITPRRMDRTQTRDFNNIQRQLAPQPAVVQLGEEVERINDEIERRCNLTGEIKELAGRLAISIGQIASDLGVEIDKFDKGLSNPRAVKSPASSTTLEAVSGNSSGSSNGRNVPLIDQVETAHIPSTPKPDLPFAQPSGKVVALRDIIIGL